MILRPRKPRIAIDMDGMAVALIPKLLAWYNEDHGTNITLDGAWAHRSIADKEKFVGDMLDDYLVRDNVFAGLDPLDGFAEALPELQVLGTVWIASTPSRNPDSATDKIRHILRHHPAIDRRKINLLKDKWLQNVDLFFDDWPTNIINFREEHPDAFIGAIAWPYNEDVSSSLTVRAEGYLDTRTAWGTLVRGAREFVENHPMLDSNSDRR